MDPAFAFTPVCVSTVTNILPPDFSAFQANPYKVADGAVVGTSTDGFDLVPRSLFINDGDDRLWISSVTSPADLDDWIVISEH